MYRDRFIQAIHDKKKVRLTFDSKEDRAQVTRKCAPMDFGASRRAREKNDRYHLWNYEGDTRPHVLILNPGQVVEIVVLDERFEPSEFVTWNTTTSPWSVRRDWGTYS